MRKLTSVALLVSLLLILAACGQAKQTTADLPLKPGKPPKPCRITSTRAACEAYLTKRFGPTTGRIVFVGGGVPVPPGICAQFALYPALCKKR